MKIMSVFRRPDFIFAHTTLSYFRTYVFSAQLHFCLDIFGSEILICRKIIQRMHKYITNIII
jgi:hypothetical protein